MAIILEQINLLNNNNNNIIIQSRQELIDYLSNSYSFIKCIKGFDNFLNEKTTLIDNDYIINQNYKFFLDHKDYCNLFLVFQNEQDIINYVQDTCQARGETIPKDWKSVLNWLTNDKTIVFNIKEFKINSFDWEEIKKNNLKK